MRNSIIIIIQQVTSQKGSIGIFIQTLRGALTNNITLSISISTMSFSVSSISV